MSNPVIPKFGRLYVRINPDSSSGPDTLRLAITDSLGGDDGPGAYSFEGEDPVQIGIIEGAVQQVTTFMDFKELESRID